MNDMKLKEKDIINFIITESQKQFSKNEQKYIHITRLNKLITLVVDEMSKKDIIVEGFTWGYYRHGFYSKTANRFLKNNFGNEFSLKDIEVSESDLPESIRKLISDSVMKIKDKFVKNRADFYGWVYREKAPKKYKNFYLTHMELEKWFEDINIKKLMSEPLKLHEKCSDILSEYYFSTDHINDLSVIETFSKFTDILEQLLIKLKNGGNPSQINMELDKIHNLYYSKIYNLMTPYLDTLKGDQDFVNSEKESHRKRVFLLKRELRKELDVLHKELRAKGIIPTTEEMHKEIHQVYGYLSDESRSIKEFYDIISEKITKSD